MLRFVRRYDRFLDALAALAALYLGAMMLAIIYFTVFRSLGWPYTPYAFVFVEYGFIYMLMFASPWLVRERGHVYIELITSTLPERVRRRGSRIVCGLTAIVCLVLAWYAGSVAVNDFAVTELDVRGRLDIPRWVVTVSLPIGFVLMGIEFVRFVFSREPMHRAERTAFE